MEKKLRQVTDSIHGTIFLSELESELISTSYFYRLHDVYQSSTVYMTFPSNRTKRYEHSLGTMELASAMLFSSISNADKDVRNKLFGHLKFCLDKILKKAIGEGQSQKAAYFTNFRGKISHLFPTIGNKSWEETFEYYCQCIQKALREECFSDPALETFQYYPMQLGKSRKENDGILNIFLYNGLLQAIRIVALFHDVGHPPYSHVIEQALNDLYKDIIKDMESEGNEKISGKSNKKEHGRVNKFKECMSQYVMDGEKKGLCQGLCSESSLSKAHLHEKIGLSFLNSVIEDVIPCIIQKIVGLKEKNETKIARILYYIVVVEFTFAILVEENTVFKSFHKIVDGVLDADRMDYIMRDTHNSAVDWGSIPYKRLINSAKLMCLEKEKDKAEAEEQDKKKEEEKGKEYYFVVAYPEKVAEDIEDLLLVRYKIFARINHHHRCMKTAATLKYAVKTLAENYLFAQKTEKAINEDIRILWEVLGMEAGNRDERVILWNDSWLISTLHNSLINLNKREDNSEFRELKNTLEEFLLNKKHYYSLLKRGSDNRYFVKRVFDNAGITEDLINAKLLKEKIKLYKNTDENIVLENILSNPKADANDSIRRLEGLLHVMKTGDLEYLFSVLPPKEETSDKFIETVLTRMKEDKDSKMLDFKMIINEDRHKNGLPQHADLLDEIYLFNSGGKLLKYDAEVSFKKQIESIEQNIPWLYIYFVPKNDKDDVVSLAKDLIDEMAIEVGKDIKERYNELFNSKA